MCPERRIIKSLLINRPCRHLLIIVLFIGLPLICTANSQQRNDKPLQLFATQNIGYGGSVGYHIFPQLYVGVDLNNLTDEGTIMDIDLDYKFQTNKIVGRYYIWDEYGFCAQIGLVYRDWTISGSDEAYIGNDTVKRKATVDITWPKTAVSYGVSWFLIGKRGISGGFGVGFISSGSPDVKISAPGASSTNIALEESKAEKTLEDYQSFPYTQLAIGWSF